MTTANDRDRVAAIEERANDGYELWFDAFDNRCQIDQQVYADIAYLLARVRETEAELKTCKRKLNLERGFVEYLTGASDENL